MGATLLRIDVPDRYGVRANVVFGFDELSLRQTAGGPRADVCLGGTCGRFANRIAGARFPFDNEIVQLVPNDGPHHLHGGPDGFHRRRWHGSPLDDGVCLILESPDGDQGWPGAFRAEASFRLIAPDTLAIVYSATTTRPTHVNLVSHPYFNLGGGMLDHQLQIAAERFLPISADGIPLGTQAPVAGTPFDFREVRAVGESYDHCYVLDGTGLRDVATLTSLISGTTLTLTTDQPGLQLYTGNPAGLCLEAQAFPDSPNQPSFPSTRLDPGEFYRSELRLSFGTL
jgi:aldose 1-epimerase